MLTVGVAVDKATLNFDKLFSYQVPDVFENQVKIGSIVIVPFGVGDKYRLGIVLSLNQEPAKKPKQIIDLKNQNTTINQNTLDLIKHLKETTFCTWFDAVKAVLPYGSVYKIKGDTLVPQMTAFTEKVYTSNKVFDATTLKSAKQKALYQNLIDKTLNIKDIEQFDIGKSVVDGLVKKQALVVTTRDKASEIYKDIRPIREPVALTDEQQKVFEDIYNCDNKKPHLIHGVTSSGKSMIFIKLIAQTLNDGKGAMLLVPEISLTPQMIKLLKEYFGDIVSVIHSKLTPTQRILEYNRLLDKKARVVVGTRSAVFAPVDNLGVIIIDEEHEKTFKSESTPRYSAVRVASFLAKANNSKLVLASATPSIESYYLAKENFYNLHTITTRYNNMPLPEVEILDMSKQVQIGDIGAVSSVIIKYLAENLIEEKQSIILINRRGYSTIGVCKDCKTPIKCDDCSVNLVKHKTKNKLICHYCGRNYDIIEKCPSCGGEIVYQGYGTQQIEEYIQNSLPTARILRMDADTTYGNNAHQQMLEAFGKKEYDILIGTQMVAKGLDFKDVKLVVILGIDSALNQPSFNANEQAYNLLVQVIGRAGRACEDAKAVIQTFDSENQTIMLAQNGNYKDYYDKEIAYRKLNIYPPYCSICTVAFTFGNELQCSKDASAFLKILKETTEDFKKQPLVVLGPTPFDVEMINKKYRWKLTIKCKNNQNFKDYLNNAINLYLQNKDNKSKIYINLNPIQE